MRMMVLLLLRTGVALATSARREDQIFIEGNRAGRQTVTELGADSMRAEYEYDDRGRGDHIIATWTLDAAGVPLAYASHGVNHMKVPVDERFTLSHGAAHWKSRAEHGEQALDGEAFFVPIDAPPALFGVLARALLKAAHYRLRLLPAGEASIEAVGSLPIATRSGSITLTRYRISGLEFAPVPVWLDPAGNDITVSNWFSTVPGEYAAALPQLIAAQDVDDNAWSARIAQALTHAPHGALLIRNARLFDPRDLSVAPGISVLIEGERIARVAADALIDTPAGAEVIDAHGRFLMPGLWDNHQHFFDSSTGVLDLAYGVTSARDMANDTDSFLQRVSRFDDGSELGPRVLKAGIIDGTGQFAGSTKMRGDTADEGLKDVDWYADHGYAQIKLYSSLKPELVPPIAEHAHARGLRVSGHVPAFMSARQFVDAGADEIQHMNFIVLNFLFPQVSETRNTARFTAVAEHAREFTQEQPEVREFIAFLKARHTVLDPTLIVFEHLFCGDPDAISPAIEKVAARLPLQVRRGLPRIALQVPKGKEAAYTQAFPARCACSRPSTTPA